MLLFLAGCGTPGVPDPDVVQGRDQPGAPSMQPLLGSDAEDTGDSDGEGPVAALRFGNFGSRNYEFVASVAPLGQGWPPGALVAALPGYWLYLYGETIGCVDGGIFVFTPEAGWSQGKEESRLHSVDDSDCLGWAVVSGVDLDGDGVSEIIASAPRDTTNGFYYGAIGSGRVEVYAGQWPPRSDQMLPETTWYGSNEWSGLGDSLDGVHDLDGDGRDELLVGSQEGTWLLHGGDLPKEGDLPFDVATFAVPDVHTVGDIDGDGVSDFGCARSAWEEDAVYLWSGASLTFDIEETAADLTIADAGGWVGPAGDIDGDGFGDFTTAGRLFQGLTLGGGTIDGAESLTFLGADGSYLWTLAPAGNFTGNGNRCLAAGGWYGNRYVFCGPDLPAVGAMAADEAAARLSGRYGIDEHTPAGLDWNDDGIDDLLGIGFGYHDEYPVYAEIWRGGP